jgi:O-antigen/teichoic acid export membrane protein
MPFVLRVTFSLSLIIALPAVIFVIFGPQIFVLLFGDTWRVAGEFMQIMMPAVAIRFVVSTLSSTLGATKNNHYGAAWKIIAFVSTLCVFVILAPTGDIVLLLKINMLKDIVIYLLYYVLICKAALNPKNISDSENANEKTY